MRIYTVIETADVEIIGISTFSDETKAREAFDKCAEENTAHVLLDVDLSREIAGTLALAGDDTYAVQLFGTDCE